MKNKHKNKNYLKIIVVISLILNIIFVLIFFGATDLIYSRPNKLKNNLNEYYYSRDNLDFSMKNILQNNYTGNFNIDFDNYIYQLVINDLNKIEPIEIAKYNKLFNPEDADKILGIIESKNPVIVDTINENICYIKIADFTRDYTYKSLIEKKDTIDNSKDYIIDLRNNSGGDMDEFRKILELFYKNDQLMYSEKNSDGIKNYYSDSKKKINFNNIVILCNSETASASEALINCLKCDYPENVYLIGSKTFGKNFTYCYQQYEDKFLFLFVTGIMQNSKGESFSSDGINPDYIIEKSDSDLIEQYAIDYIETKQ